MSKPLTKLSVTINGPGRLPRIVEMDEHRAARPGHRIILWVDLSEDYDYTTGKTVDEWQNSCLSWTCLSCIDLEFPPCTTCGRDNRHGTHDALERIGHLNHSFTRVEKTVHQIHQPMDAACIGHMNATATDAVCPVCRPEEYDKVPRGQWGRCEAFDNGGDAHFIEHECRTPLKEDGTCPWHGKNTGFTL